VTWQKKDGKVSSNKETAKTGRLGELLVQCDLLDLDVDSSPMTTDTGVDLLARVPGARQALTVQVKTRTAQLGGNRPSWTVKKGKEALAELFAFVDPDTREIWYVDSADLRSNFDKEPHQFVVSFYRAGYSNPRMSGGYKSEAFMQQFKGKAALHEYLRKLRPVRKKRKGAAIGA
jgi:hypothetical protein